MNSTMTSILKLALVGLLALALVAFIAACSSSSGDGEDAASGGNGDVAEHVDDADEHEDADADDHGETEEQEDGGAVHVSLTEWGIAPAHGETFEADAGELVFEIHNEGAAPHDLKVIRTDLSPDALPVTDGLVDQEAAGEVIGGVEPIPGGEIYVEPYHLEAGDYVIICTIAGHYQQGMSAGLTVH
jgi:uncharacterized cupredoxin-like copper-binding protein